MTYYDGLNNLEICMREGHKFKQVRSCIVIWTLSLYIVHLCRFAALSSGMVRAKVNYFIHYHVIILPGVAVGSNIIRDRKVPCLCANYLEAFSAK